MVLEGFGFPEVVVEEAGREKDSAHAAPILKPGHIIACLGCTDGANAFVQGEYGSDDDDAKFRKEAILNFLWEKKNGG